MLSICVYFTDIVHFYIAVLFINVILGLDPRIQVYGVASKCEHNHCSLLSTLCSLKNDTPALRATPSGQRGTKSNRATGAQHCSLHSAL